jgi:hypothetical protein
LVRPAPNLLTTALRLPVKGRSLLRMDLIADATMTSKLLQHSMRCKLWT